MAFVYFFEYCIITCFADRMQVRLQTLDSSTSQFFIILNWCYQVGVFISRSSLHYFKIDNVQILCLIQLVNWVLIFLNTQFLVCSSLAVLGPMFVWTGLMGGSCYVNVMHNLLKDESLEESEKQGSIIMSLVSNDLGVLMSALFTILVDNTLFKSH